MKKLLFSYFLVASLASSVFGGYYIDKYGNLRYQIDISSASLNNQNANAKPQTNHQSIYSNAFCAWIGCGF